MKGFFLALPGSLAVTSIAFFAAGCGIGKPPEVQADIQYAQATNSARVAYDGGLMPQAALLYQRALDRAEVMDEPREISDAAYNLAAALVRGANPDDLPRARRLLDESRRATIAYGGDVSSILLMQSKIARLQQDRQSARELAGQVLGDPHANTSSRLSAHLLKGELALDENDVSAAEAELKMSRDAAATASISQRAGIAGLTARLEVMKHDPASAANDFNRQAELLQQAGLYHEMAAARAAAGEQSSVAGKPAEAADRLFRAARSAAVQGFAPDAQRWAAAALKAAEQARDTTLVVEIQSFIRDRGVATQPATESPNR